jgi:hypothetical protein
LAVVKDRHPDPLPRFGRHEECSYGSGFGHLVPVLMEDMPRVYLGWQLYNAEAIRQRRPPLTGKAGLAVGGDSMRSSVVGTCGRGTRSSPRPCGQAWARVMQPNKTVKNRIVGLRVQVQRHFCFLLGNAGLLDTHWPMSGSHLLEAAERTRMPSHLRDPSLAASQLSM